MTDKEKLQTINQWIDEAIRQGNNTVLVMAIKSILMTCDDVEKEIGYGSKLKLTEKARRIKEIKNDT